MPCSLWWVQWVSSCRNSTLPLASFGIHSPEPFLFASFCHWAAPWPLVIPTCWSHFCILDSFLCSGMVFPWMLLSVIMIMMVITVKIEYRHICLQLSLCWAKRWALPGFIPPIFAAARCGAGAQCGMGAWKPQSDLSRNRRPSPLCDAVFSSVFTQIVKLLH